MTRVWRGLRHALCGDRLPFSGGMQKIAVFGCVSEKSYWSEEVLDRLTVIKRSSYLGKQRTEAVHLMYLPVDYCRYS